ncbi:MAG TPA: GNAT family N-acetyltransferase [Candidatus Thermoplasmatota archaeon]|nr:GNAT family N-acetyltransferase [Candidatus Thermoplasmatota archaeon]
MASDLPPGVRVRDARPEDAEAILALYKASYSMHADPHRPPTAGLRDTIDDVRAYLRDMEVLVAEDGAGRVVGTVGVRSVANVRRLAVDPGRAGGGLGGALLEAAVARAKARGFEVAMLDTYAGHPWLPGFYRRHGFEDRSVERFPDGSEWLQLRRRLRE